MEEPNWVELRAKIQAVEKLLAQVKTRIGLA